MGRALPPLPCPQTSPRQVPAVFLPSVGAWRGCRSYFNLGLVHTHHRAVLLGMEGTGSRTQRCQTLVMLGSTGVSWDPPGVQDLTAHSPQPSPGPSPALTPLQMATASLDMDLG